MSYCGEVSEEDWCSFHACMRNMCRWQHEETFEQQQARITEAKNTHLAAARKAQLQQQTA